MTVISIPCKTCGTRINSGDQFCAGCGGKTIEQKPSAKFCTNCGNSSSDDSRFCANCGMQTKAVKRESAPGSLPTRTVKREPTPKERKGSLPMLLAGIGSFVAGIISINIGESMNQDIFEMIRTGNPTPGNGAIVGGIVLILIGIVILALRYWKKHQHP